MPYQRHRQLRDVALLVASLDERWTERLLSHLPPKDAAAVWEAVDQLGPIDPQEQLEIIEKFRQSTIVGQPTKVDGVELDASLLARLEEQSPDNGSCTSRVGQSPLDALTEDEELAVVNALCGEHPQTIAVVLSRLDPANASKLLTKLSPTMQADVLARLANFDLADEQTVRVVESQLALWLQQSRQQKQRMAAGMNLVEQILKSTPHAQRKTILTQLGSQNPTLATRLTPKQQSVAAEYPQPVAPIHNIHAVEEPPKKALSQFPQPLTVAENTISADPLAVLEKLDDAALFAALAESDREVAALALAGASDFLMARVLRGLPRRQASKLRRQLRNIGPTRLSDMISAQQQLLQSAKRLVGAARNQELLPAGELA